MGVKQTTTFNIDDDVVESGRGDARNRDTDVRARNQGRGGGDGGGRADKAGEGNDGSAARTGASLGPYARRTVRNSFRSIGAPCADPCTWPMPRDTGG